jgi:hypothetical protein
MKNQGYDTSAKIDVFSRVDESNSRNLERPCFNTLIHNVPCRMHRLEYMTEAEMVGRARNQTGEIWGGGSDE